MHNEEEKKREGQKNPEEFLQEVWKEVNDLKNDIVEETIDDSIQNEKSELDNLQNAIIWHIEKNEWSIVETEKVLWETQKNIAEAKKEKLSPYQPVKEKVDWIVPPEVIRANQTKSRLNVEKNLVPIAWMPRRLINKLDLSI
jgi:hypothetical protein